MDVSKKMQISLRNAFSTLGYQQERQQLSLIKLMAYDGLLQGYCIAKAGEFLSTQDAIKILDAQKFELLSEAIDYIFHSTNTIEAWLRPTTNEEGKDAATEDNLARWKMKESARYSKHRSEFIDLLSAVSIIPMTWPAGLVTQHVILHGGLENSIVTRLNMLQPFTGKFYYVTGTRGAFNDEPTTAAVIAEWLDKPEATSSIREQLEKFKNISDWLHGLEAVKQAILKVTNSSAWPSGKGYYYKNKDIYDLENTYSLQDWPVATDLVAFLLKSNQLFRSRFENGTIQLIGVPTLGKERKLANTDDNMELWLKLYGQKLIAENPDQKVNVVCLSSDEDNLFMIERQDAVAKKYLTADHFNVVTIGSRTGNVHISRCLDTLTRLLYIRGEVWRRNFSASIISKMRP